MTRVLAVLLALLVSRSALAEAPPAPELAAKTWLLLDATSGQRLASRDPDERIEPASLTKLMTAYIAFSALRQKALAPAQSVAVSERAWHAAG